MRERETYSVVLGPLERIVTRRCCFKRTSVNFLIVIIAHHKETFTLVAEKLKIYSYYLVVRINTFYLFLLLMDCSMTNKINNYSVPTEKLLRKTVVN
jgi:hypothetical protein